MSRALGSAALFGAITSATLFACGSDPPIADGGASGGTPNTPPGAAPGQQPPPPDVKRELPATTPSLGGFTLVDAFPNVEVNVPSAAVWPKVASASAGPFVLQRMGSVVQIEGAARRAVLDFSGSVAMMSEGGALGMALHPMFGDGTGPKPYAYFWYNANGSKQRLSRFTWIPASRTFDPSSEKILLEEQELKAEHNAGRVAFGPDGFLYFGNGDDIDDANHQRIDRALFAGIFRIDVDMQGGAVSHPPPRQPQGGYSSGYFIPNDNPFVGTPNALEEYYALGFRNPFGFSFDRATGQLWTADVGDTWREEVDLVVSGGNYEWPYREGDVLRGTTPTSIGVAQSPKHNYSHAEMADLTAVLGGFVYRGKELPELAGKYIYSDWPSGRIWALDIGATPATRTTLMDKELERVPLALAEDNDGEIYVLHLEGIAKLARDPSKDMVPKRLSLAIGVFKDVAALELEPAFVPYEINSPLWSDGAVKRRWIRVPDGARVEVADDGSMKFPVGTVFVKHFELPPRRLETRILVAASDTIYGLTYRWNVEGTDADLVLEGADEAIEDPATGQTRTWHYPSFGQCWSCHRADYRVLGFTGPQLVLTRADGKEQLSELAWRGVFDAASTVKLAQALARPSDTTASLEARATAYLAANCSSCHHEGASFLGGGETWNALPGVPLAERGLVGAPHHNMPMARAIGLVSAPLVDPGNPANSILLARVKSNDPDLRMPPLARNVVDEDGARLLEEWIRAMK